MRYLLFLCLSVPLCFAQWVVDRKIPLTMPANEIFGQCDYLNGVYVRFQDDDIYVLDSSLNRIVRFDRKGAFRGAFVETGPAPKEVSKIGAFAVSHSYVVVIDALQYGRYLVFQPDGTYRQTVNFGDARTFEGHCNPVIVDDKYLVISYFAQTERRSNQRILVLDLLTGATVAKTGKAVARMDTLIGQIAPVVDGSGFWLQIPYTHKPAYYAGLS